LPWFRCWLAMLNWGFVVDYELREIEFERSKREYEQMKIAHEHGMKQLRGEISQIERENERFAKFNAKIGAISSSLATHSTPVNPTPNESEM